MKELITKALRARKVMIGRDFYQGRQLRRERLTMGNRYASWTICPDGLDASCILYSFGVGFDVSWDLSMIERFGMQIHAFDPSPSSVEWVDGQKFPEQFHFHPVGLSNTDGEISFSEPVESGAQSLQITGTGEPLTKTHLLPVKRLGTLMETLHHQQIDILKMDIEGAEYGVIEDFLDAGIPVTQVLIEFHHRFPHIGVARTREAIRRLNRAGYRIFHVAPSGEEMSFIQ